MSISVSVIIPNYNHAKFLEQRINSVLNQTYKEFEIIILDDSSTDNSRDIIEKYRNNKKVSSIIYNEKNSGSTFRQWKKGFELATGDLIWIAESDDYADDIFLEKHVNNFKYCNSIVLSYCYSFLVNDRNEILPIIRNTDRIRDNSPIIIDGKDFILKNMIYGNTIYNASAVVFKRNILNHVDENYINYRFCGDWFFWNEILYLGKIAIVYQKMNYFRQHQNKISPRAEKEGLCFSEGLDVFLNIMNKMNIAKLKQCEFAGYFYYRILTSKKLDDNIKISVWNLWKLHYKHPFFYILLQIFKHFPSFCEKLIKSIYNNIRTI
jgi:glycosyltransferase involved in cell wall biosynthesis